MVIQRFVDAGDGFYLLQYSADVVTDKRFEARLYELLAEINKECAIILVSHDIGTVLQQVKSVYLSLSVRE